MNDSVCILSLLVCTRRAVSKGKDGSAHFSAAIKHTEVGGRERERHRQTHREKRPRDRQGMPFQRRLGEGKGPHQRFPNSGSDSRRPYGAGNDPLCQGGQAKDKTPTHNTKI